MAINRRLQFVRGSTARNDAFTGREGELTVDTNTWTLRVHDGVTPGGNSLGTSNFSGSYSDLTGAPTIPADVGDLTDTGGLLFDGTYASLTGVPVLPTDIADLTDEENLIPTDLSQLTDATGVIPTDVSELTDTHNIILTLPQIIAGMATEEYVDDAIANLVDTAPGTLNTLNELAAAIGDDPNYASTVAGLIGAKANSADLATVATSGRYLDLTNKPFIPTDVSDLTDTEGLLTHLSFDQDLNSTDSPNFVNLGLAGTAGAGYASLSITDNRDFVIGLNDNVTGSKVFEFGRDGSLSVPGETTFNANIYGGTNNRLWLGGSAEEGTPSISLPNNTDGASQPITINNGQGGGVQITTGAGNWTFGQDGSATFPNGAVIKDNADSSVSFGGGAGASYQGAGAVAIGEGAGNNEQSNQAVAIGRGSGNYQQGVGAVGIGFCAGATEQGNYAVAIGFKAARGNMDNDGTPNQPANSIMINASSTPLNGDQAGLYINPVREDNTNTAKVVYYNTTTKELTYTDATGGSGNSLSSDNENITVTIENAGSPGNTLTWTFATDEFVYLPSGGIIGDIFGGGMTGIQADPDAPDAYASLVSGDKQQAVDATNDEVIIWADDDAQGGTLTKQWKFNRAGEMEFPDATVQTTAYTGNYNDLTNKPTIPTLGNFSLSNNTITTSNGDTGIDLVINGGTSDDPPSLVNKAWRFVNDGSLQLRSPMNLGSEVDATITSTKVGNWDTAYGWGDHATEGYVKSDTTGITGADQVTNMVTLTQAEYDAITPNASTVYFIVG